MKVIGVIGSSAWAAACACASALGVVACSSAGLGARPEPVSTTTTTSAEAAYAPGEVELYVARSTGQDSCRATLSPDVNFSPRTVDLLPGEARALDTWAGCLKEPALAHTTLVLLGGEGQEDPAGTFARRAQIVRTMLIARGVDPQRIVIGPPNATREGGPYAARSAVHVESTYMQTVRGVEPRTRAAVR